MCRYPNDDNRRVRGQWSPPRLRTRQQKERQREEQNEQEPSGVFLWHISPDEVGTGQPQVADQYVGQKKLFRNTHVLETHNKHSEKEGGQSPPLLDGQLEETCLDPAERHYSSGTENDSGTNGDDILTYILDRLCSGSSYSTFHINYLLKN